MHEGRERIRVEVGGRVEEVIEYHETMVTQPGLHDNDLVLWTQLLAEVLNAEIAAAPAAEHPHVRYAHGFLIQQLVEGPRPVGEIAENLGVTSQAVSKSVRELEALGYVDAPERPGRRARAARGADRQRAGPCSRPAARSARRSTRELAEALGAERAAGRGGER